MSNFEREKYLFPLILISFILKERNNLCLWRYDNPEERNKYFL